MKRLLSIYIIREITTLFLLGITIFTMILLMGRLITLTDLVVSHGVKLVDVGFMILYLIPSFLVLTIPMAFLLAVLLAFGRLSADNEIVVLKSCGISLAQMLPPVIVCAGIAMSMALAASSLGVPWGNSAFKDLSLRVLKQNIAGTIREKLFWDDIPGVVMYTDRYDEQSRALRGVVIHDGRNPQRSMTIFAKEGSVSSPSGSQAFLLTLRNGSIHVPGNDDKYRLVSFGEYHMSVGEKGGGSANSRSMTDMWFAELTDAISNPATSAPERRKLQAELYSRFTFPVASLVFAVLAVPLGIQNRRSGKSSGFAVSILIILSYYVLMSVARSLAENGAVTPFISLWLPNVVFLASGLLLLRMATAEKQLPALPDFRMLSRFFRGK